MKRDAKIKQGKLHIFCTSVITKLDSAEKIFFGWFLNPRHTHTRSFKWWKTSISLHRVGQLYI